MRHFRTSLFVAYKSVTRGSRSMLALMIFIMALSYFNMMFISGVLAGLWQSQEELIRDHLTGEITIYPQEVPQPKQYVQNQDMVQAQVATIPGIEAIARHYQMAGSLSHDTYGGGRTKNVSGPIIGVDPSAERAVLHIERLLIEGAPLSETDSDSIMLSSALAGGFGTPSVSDLGGVKTGEKIRITYPNGIIRTYNVKGIYNDLLGIYETFITAKEAESVLGTTNAASQLIVRADISDTPVEYYVERIRLIAPNLKLQNFNDLLGSFGSFQRALALISSIVSAISVIVAAITIFVLIYVNAINRKRQIGILKAIGIEEHIIVNAYVMQSLFYTVCGLLIGAVLVFAIFRPLITAHPIPIIEGFMNLSLAYTPTGIIAGIIAFLVAGYLAGRMPARLVARQDILKAIWG